jgi:hypothetical protein
VSILYPLYPTKSMTPLRTYKLETPIFRGDPTDKA